MKVLSLILFSVLFLSCNQGEIDQLKKEIDKINEQLNAKSMELIEAKKSEEKFNFLNKSLTGIKCRIITDYGNLELEFYPDKAPLHVAMFIARAEAGFYNGTQFHRVISGFMIQGGDPNSKDNNFSNDGSGGPIFMIPHEFNDVKHVPGILSTARRNDKSEGAGCQFFVMHGVTPQLDNEYTVFGKVTKGMEIVDKIANVAKDNRDHPVKAIRIKEMIVYK
jgi:peptidyl-prolyl cis-trans isomerase B (cyclophilin B)